MDFWNSRNFYNRGNGANNGDNNASGYNGGFNGDSGGFDKNDGGYNGNSGGYDEQGRGDSATENLSYYPKSNSYGFGNYGSYGKSAAEEAEGGKSKTQYGNGAGAPNQSGGAFKKSGVSNDGKKFNQSNGGVNSGVNSGVNNGKSPNQTGVGNFNSQNQSCGNYRPFSCRNGNCGAKTSAYQDDFQSHRVDGDADFSAFKDNLNEKARDMGMDKQDFESKFNKYQGKTEDSLMNELLNMVGKMKADGTFSEQELDSFYDRVSGYMSAEQKDKLRSLIKMLKGQ